MFDRCFILGNDTVVIKKEGLEWQKEKKEVYRDKLFTAAETVGYTLVHEDEYSYVFHVNLPEHVGIVSDYDGIAIGESSSSVTLLFPSFHEGKSDNLQDYTLEELSDYRLRQSVEESDVS